ncbi:MAG TPA: 4'-phosphopantetheinyl transferase superfamily protein, partial [Aquificae bacterium]|nr:4'-phosphopantetheinyl transferase superfamily protein [Aquificota bacterium]
MKLLVGIDIVENDRIKEIKSLEKFLNKIFPEGLSYCKENRIGEFYGCIAARFALKEAFIKAFSKLDIKIFFSDIKIISGGKNLKVELLRDIEKELKDKHIVSTKVVYIETFKKFHYKDSSGVEVYYEVPRI